jgi:hypothetical protein
MLTHSQTAVFQARGLIRLDDFLPAQKVATARDIVYGVLEQHGIRQEGTWHLDQFEPSTSVVAGSKLVRGIKKSKAFADLMISDRVIVKCGVWQHDQAALFCCSKVA